MYPDLIQLGVTPLKTNLITFDGYAVEFTFDRMKIYTTASKKSLVQILPVKRLRKLAPYFYVHNEDGKGGFLSSICFKCPSIEFLKLLMEYEEKLGDYKIYSIELAIDQPKEDEREVIKSFNQQVPKIRKLWQVSDELKWYEGGYDCPEDIIPDCPTAYWEDKNAFTSFKVYGRYSPVHGQAVLRSEFTLRRAGAIKRKIGIEKLADLLTFDPAPFINSHIQAEIFNRVKFGKFLYGDQPVPKPYMHRGKPLTSPDYHLHRAATIYQAIARDEYDVDIPPYIKPKRLPNEEWTTASKNRQHLRMMMKTCKEDSDHPWEQRFAKMTPYQLNGFFEKATANNYVSHY